MPEKKLVHPETGHVWTVSYDDGDSFLMIMTQKGDAFSGNTRSLNKNESIEEAFNNAIKEKLKEGFTDPEQKIKLAKKTPAKKKLPEEPSSEELELWWKNLS